MPTGTFDYRDEAERVAIEQAIAFVTQIRNLAGDAPHGRVIDHLEGHAWDAGRELLRGTRERVQPHNWHAFVECALHGRSFSDVADGTRTPNAVKAGVRRVRDLHDKLYRVCLAGEIIE